MRGGQSDAGTGLDPNGLVCPVSIILCLDSCITNAVQCTLLATDIDCEYGGSMLRPTALHCVTIQKTTVYDSYPLVQTVHRAEVCSKLCGIRTTTTPAPEELGL